MDSSHSKNENKKNHKFPRMGLKIGFAEQDHEFWGIPPRI